MTPFQIYLFTRLELINALSWMFTTIFGIVTLLVIAWFVATWLGEDKKLKEEHEITAKALKRSSILSAISLLVYVAVPTQKEMAAIMVLPKIASQQNLDKLTEPNVVGVDIIKMSAEYLKDTLKIKTENDNG